MAKASVNFSGIAEDNVSEKYFQWENLGKQQVKTSVPHTIVGQGVAYAIPDKTKGDQDEGNDGGQ